MRTIIAGSRNLTDLGMVEAAMEDAMVEAGIRPSLVVSGGARGVDALGERWATFRNIPIKVFPARWDLYGNRAGPLRNREMAKYAQALVAVWDGVSPGTGSMIRCARDYGLLVYVARFTHSV